MNNTEKKIDWIFEALRFHLDNTSTENPLAVLRLLDNADRIIADIETEKEEPTMESKIEDSLRD